MRAFGLVGCEGDGGNRSVDRMYVHVERCSRVTRNRGLLRCCMEQGNIRVLYSTGSRVTICIEMYSREY